MVFLFGIKIDDISTAHLEQTVRNWLNLSKGHLIFTPNPEFLLTARKNPWFQELLNQSDLSLPDGIGLRFASAALSGNRLKHRQTGIDTLNLLARVCRDQNKRLLLLGAMGNVSLEAAKRLRFQYKGLDVKSINPGELSGHDQSLTLSSFWIEKIRNLKPDVIAVALGQGKQERCCVELLDKIPSVKIAMGVGGALDMIAGRFPRAPHFLRTYGLEWVWRVFVEPKRFTRIINASLIFPSVVILGTLKCRRFWKAFFAVTQEFTSLGKL